MKRKRSAEWSKSSTGLGSRDGCHYGIFGKTMVFQASLEAATP